jgi:hypothetical protein
LTPVSAARQHSETTKIRVPSLSGVFCREIRVGLKINRRRTLRALLGAFVTLCASFMAAGCAANSYAGISFAPGAAEPELQAIARRARQGDKGAQLELGIRYEEGRGVPVDLRLAEALYAAAAGSAFRLWSHVPAVGPAHSIMIPIPLYLSDGGLQEAAVRLQRLRSSGRPFTEASDDD